MKNRVLGLLALAALAINSLPAAAAASADTFARLPEIGGVTVSPDGDRLAVQMRVKGRTVLNILRLADMKSIGTFGMHDQRDIEDVYWKSNDRLLFGISYREGKEEAKVATGDLMAVNVDGSGVATLLAPQRGNLLVLDLNFRDWRMVDMLRDDPNNVLIYKYEADSPMPYLYRLNVKTGSRNLVMQARNRGGGFMTDHEGKVRFQWGDESDGTTVILSRDSADGPWREVGRYAYDDEDDGADFDPIAFAGDNRRIYYRAAAGERTIGLYVLDPESGAEPQLLHRDDTYDVRSLVPGRRRGEFIGAAWEAERTQWRFFEPLHPDVPLFDALRKAFGGRDISIVNRSADGSKAVVYAGSDVDPGAYYVFDMAKASVLARFPTHPWLQSSALRPMEPVSFKARDGIQLHGYLTRPANAAQAGRKRMVVLVHGGPIGVRDYWGYDSEVQWLAANGFAVLQVNFRGSGGYGPAFENAGYGEFGGKMQDDVTDATRWAIEQGHADASAICIYGASYGAYAAMMGLIREPDLYRCGVGYAGLYDLDLWTQHSLAASSSETRAYQRKAVGEDRVHLRRISPTSRAAEIKVPVLLVHGGDDERTPVNQFRAMQAALRKADKPFEFILKDKEEHGFYNEANVAEFYSKLVEFLDKNTR